MMEEEGQCDRARNRSPIVVILGPASMKATRAGVQSAFQRSDDESVRIAAGTGMDGNAWCPGDEVDDDPAEMSCGS